jgi:hypothetical protein
VEWPLQAVKLPRGARSACFYRGAGNPDHGRRGDGGSGV